MAIKSYSSAAASNTSLFPENMAPSAVNDGMRQVQADIRSWYVDAQWIDRGDPGISRASASSFKITGDVTGEYLVGRRLKLYDATTLYGVIATSTYGAPDTTIGVTTDSGSLTTSLTSVAVGILTPTNKSLPQMDLDTLTVSGVAQFKGTATISGAAVFKTTASVDGEATISGTLTLKTVVVGAAMADASAQEAATAVNRIVSPGVQQRHPSSSKAWLSYDYTTGPGTPSILSSYNVGSLSDIGTGEVGVNVTTAFSSTNYVPVASQGNDGAPRITGLGTAGWHVIVRNTSFAAFDTDPNYTAAFGDQ